MFRQNNSEKIKLDKRADEQIEIGGEIKKLKCRKVNS